MGVIVLGMHRSGTSAVTRVINLLGARVGGPVMAPQPDNPAGFWEVESLMHLNDDLLGRLGGSWDAPPAPPPGWERSPSVAEVASHARDVFASAHPSEPWVWKDPRVCVLLPFWLAVLGRRHVAVVVLRDPVAIARSLARRNGLPPRLALAVWERSMRGVLRDAAALPALVVRYDDVVDAPRAAVDQVASFLRAQRIARPRRSARAAARHSLLSDLRHTRPGAELDRLGPDASPEQRELLTLLDASVGVHPAWQPPELPPETPWVAAVVDERAHTG
jgi:hypothetical protein